MRKRLALVVFWGFITACSGSSSSNGGGGGGSGTFTVSDRFATVQQNTTAVLDLGGSGHTSVSVVQAPAHGSVTLDGLTATYRPDPLYSGTDTFTFTVSKGTETSSPATATITLTPIAGGNYTFTETYSANGGTAHDLSGWKIHQTGWGHSANSVLQYSATVWDGMPVTSRKFGVYADTSYHGDAHYMSVFGMLPIDGAGGNMHDWPWMAEVVHIPQCGVDVTVTMKLVPNGGIYPMGAILLNYDINRSGGKTTLNGYQLLFNGGGGSLTLSRFISADETATAFLDRWPNTGYGTENYENPITSGPYKGWNYKNGMWAAGGNVGTLQPLLIAVRYQYNRATKETVISYEARDPGGTDGTPGAFEESVTLSGADSLPPGGDFGILATNYHTPIYIQPTDYDIVEYKLDCTVP